MTAGGSPLGSRLAISVTEAAELIGVSRSTYYREAAKGRLPLLHISPRRSVVPTRALMSVIDQEVPS